MLVMDSAPRPSAALIVNDGARLHRPGSLRVTDADRQARGARQSQADQKLSERWKAPAPVEAVRLEQVRSPAPAPATDKAKMYAAADKKLSERWESGGAR